ncbi:hypothetical protein, partial [Streptomyces purpurogeneiscleroticus]|uniref:hypothetical protein n=1 Tax=Streptomyces purpurogeneiscleroticus TaxID=68259 RepID=UPI001CBD8CCF
MGKPGTAIRPALTLLLAALLTLLTTAGFAFAETAQSGSGTRATAPVNDDSIPSGPAAPTT